MQQTLLAMLALLLATFMHYNQMQALVRGEREMVREEMEEMATSVAMRTMEVIRARAFDEETIGVPSDSMVATSEFSSMPFTDGKHCKAFGGTDTCNDVDDFHEMEGNFQTQEGKDVVKLAFDTPDGNINFTVEVDVYYVDGSLQEVSTPTIRKKVNIYVQDIQTDGESFLDRPIRFSETLTYSS